MTRHVEKTFEILLVEDNASDVRLTMEAFKESKARHRFSVASDGVDAMDFLRRRGRHHDAVRPDLILLDLNLPRKNGREVLHELKDDADLRRIPVIVLTTSNADRDVNECYDLHANCYVTKPVDMEQFIAIVQAIDAFWFQAVRLPARESH